ncbi:hypothetical protein [Sphingomonas mucosissima]|uniref:Uncharacterized protein n=1 Tax=Sphingomonas mucosissima TaxID=370959 RepID=A0A245ZQT1_9SPHN|nr:hypothetical protein [Sphingomonas mucosissima]OWK32104.1 hypothetical protein SPMU_04250 [Sphingomonas mucosissima]
MSLPVERKLTSLDGACGVQVALRSAMMSIAVLTPGLWVMPVAYCLYLMLLLDVARPGRSGESLVGLVGMAVVLIGFHALLLTRRQQILAALSAAYDIAGRKLHQVEQDSLRHALLGGAAAALVDAASLPLLLAILALISGWLVVIPLFGVMIGALILMTEARRMKRCSAPGEPRRMRDAFGVLVDNQRDHLALLGLADRAAAVATAHRHAAALSDAANTRRPGRAKAGILAHGIVPRRCCRCRDLDGGQRCREHWRNCRGLAADLFRIRAATPSGR